MTKKVMTNEPMICIECNDNTGSDDLICPDCLKEISGYNESEECDDSTDSD